MAKKYNRQTGGYKINILYNGEYVGSTDKYRRCMDARQSYINLSIRVNNPLDINLVKCFFDKD